MQLMPDPRASVLTGLLGLTMLLVGAATVRADDRITRDDTPGSYARLDGTVDQVHAACGTNRRQQVEPSVAVNPRDPSIIAVGAMDACIAVQNPLPVSQAQHWAAYYRSVDAGKSWRGSLLPGYPGDASQPVEAGCVIQGDATLAFDNDGRLFYGGLCLVFAGDTVPADFQIAVATYDRDGARHVGTVRVDEPAPTDALSDPLYASDKPNLVVDQTSGPHAGNVYIAWTGNCPRLVPERGPRSVAPCVGDEGVIQVSRSTDHGSTFSQPVTVTPAGPPLPHFADLAVGPDGAVYLTFRTKGDRLGIWIARSTDGGRSFSAAELVERLTPFDSKQFSGWGSGAADPIQGEPCGDGPFACPTGLTYPSFRSVPAVAADERGVHLVWNAELESGQSKVFVRNSPDGVGWPSPAVALDSVARGHQWWPDIASAGGVISAVFMDSRTDAAYSPDLPPGATAQGGNSGPAVDTFLAQSRDGGVSWTERRLSTVSSQPNYETYLGNRAPWRGDYLYVSAVPGGAYAVWPDSRDVVPGQDTRPDSEQNGLDVFAPCSWTPNAVAAPPTGYASPSYTDPCLSQGGLDLNVYGARIGDTKPPAAPTCLARRSPIGPRNIGRVRLGYSRRRLLRLPVKPVRRARRSFRYCVKRSKGRVRAVFSRPGRVVVVATTARRHGNRGLRPGRRVGALRAAYPRRFALGHGLYRAGPKSPHVIGVRRGRIRFVAVVTRRLLRSSHSLRRHLRFAGL